jgi:alkylhydroperoxidase/carboxymuconolactone decarboxylase family protein YurZ
MPSSRTTPNSLASLQMTRLFRSNALQGSIFQLCRGVSTSSTPQSGPLPRSSLARMPAFGEVDFTDDHRKPGGLPPKDLSLVQLYIGGCNHYWNMLPDLAEACKREGASTAEIWGAIRHLIVFAGYAPCLAATIKLREKNVMEEFSPGKIGGPPGNAFELVYDKVRGCNERLRERGASCSTSLLPRPDS